MGGILQKKKNKSGLTRVKQKSKVTKAGKKKINTFGNSVIAENWYGSSHSHPRSTTMDMSLTFTLFLFFVFR